MNKLDQLAEEVYLLIAHRVRLTGGPGLGQCHRSNLDTGPEVDAALAVLQTRQRIVAYQRCDSWTFTLPEPRFTHPAIDVLRDSNPHIVEEAANNPEVEAAAIDWVKRNQRFIDREATQSDYIGHGGGYPQRAVGRVRYTAPRLEVEYHRDGGARLIIVS